MTIKSILSYLLCAFLALSGFAQQKAVTETGREVLLYEDGTWSYISEGDEEPGEIPVNPDPFEKDKKSTFLLKSTVIDYGFYLSPKAWGFEKSKDVGAVEYKFKRKGEDLYGMAVTERLEIPFETLRAIAVENGRKAAPDLEVIEEEYRTVNGHKVMMLKMKGTIQGLKFKYYGYYSSSESGTVQFLTYTTDNLFERYKGDMEKLLNGLVILEE